MIDARDARLFESPAHHHRRPQAAASRAGGRRLCRVLFLFAFSAMVLTAFRAGVRLLPPGRAVAVAAEAADRAEQSQLFTRPGAPSPPGRGGLGVKRGRAMAYWGWVAPRDRGPRWQKETGAELSKAEWDGAIRASLVASVSHSLSQI